ncbi:gallidermin family lantibiotic [Ligilactobacillus cholophilus]|uniref:gallidermin family lantibiotic n=1 Tax=Ligilactobacillus cholophilus TaxID=3050131 RepID=UPI0025AFFA42|nr:gallidermin family lantibiotic [Ligilactobacillus cholophilus]
MSTEQLLEVMENEQTTSDLLDLNESETIVMSNDDPDTRLTSYSLCTPGCAHTGSFNSYCC